MDVLDVARQRAGRIERRLTGPRPIADVERHPEQPRGAFALERREQIDELSHRAAALALSVLDDEPRPVAHEVDHVRPDRRLLADVQAVRLQVAQVEPQQDFGFYQTTTERTGFLPHFRFDAG